MSSNHSSTFAALLADILRRIDRGEAIDRERLLADHEELCPQLESFFRDQSLIGELVRQAGLPTNGEANSKPSPANPGRFADFELLEEIGRGGMGVVYRARQLRPERMVALKMVLAGRHASERSLRRFYLEAEAAARLRHPSIVPIHQVGEHDGLAYYVMDFIEGESLDDRLARGPLPPRTAAEMLLEITRAVAHAHAQGVVHRDLKPANILIEMRNNECGMGNVKVVQCPTPKVKRELLRTTDYGLRTTDDRTTAYITDFGLARLLDTDDQLTITGEVVGTACYMSPEQAGHPGSSIGPAADVYGLGAVLYAMLTGRPPFQAASRDQTIAQLKFKEPAPPRSINAAIPRDLETIALKCLQKSPARRYFSAEALADDLARYLAGKSISARPISSTERALRLVRRNPVTSSLVSLLAMSLIAGAIVGVVLSIQASRHAADSAHHLYIAHMNLAQQYWDAGRTAPVLDILRRYIPTEGEPDVRGWEWHYQWSLCHREIRRFGEWKGGVKCVAVSPDGTLTAAAGDEGIVQVFDTATGNLAARLVGHKGTVYALAFSPDGKVIASGGVDHQIRLWDFADLPPLRPVEEPPGRREGRGEGQTTIPPIAVLARHTGDIRSLAFSPDGSRLVSSSEDGNAWLWDMKTHQPIRSIHTGRAWAITFDRTGQRVACAAPDGLIHLWNATTGDEMASFPGHSKGVYGLAFNLDGTRLFSAASDGLTRCMDSSTGDLIWSVKHPARFYCLSLAADERSIAVGSDDQTIRLYDAATGKAQGVFRGHTDWIHGVAILPDCSRIISASADGSVRLWSALCAEEGRTLRGHDDQVHSLAFSPDGKALATASNDSSIGLWDSSSGFLRQRLQGPITGLTSVAFNPGGAFLAAGGRDYIVHCLGPNGAVEELFGHCDMVGGIVYSPDGSMLASGSADDTVRIWDLAEHRTRRILHVDAGNVTAVEFSPDGKLLATAHDDGRVRTWNVADGELCHIYLGHGRNARDIDFSPDGTWFASCGGDAAIRFWDTASGEELSTLQGHDGTVYSVAVNADASRVVSGGNDQTVKLWDVQSGQELRTLRFGEQIRSVAFSPDGRQIAAAGANGTVRIWEVPPGRKVLDSPSTTAASSIEREAVGLVICLLESGRTKLEAEEHIRAETSVSASVRNAALAILDEYPLDEFASYEGHHLAKAGEWAAAAQAFARAANNAPNNFDHWHHWALCELQSGRRQEYSEVCRKMISQFASDTRPYCGAQVLRTCLVGEDSSVRLDELRPLVDRLRKQLSPRQSSTRWPDGGQDLAIWDLRTGHPKTAERLMLGNAHIVGASLTWHSQMALIEAALGKPAASLESVKQARAAEGELPWPWYYRAVSDFYLQEARRLLDAK